MIEINQEELCKQDKIYIKFKQFLDIVFSFLMLIMFFPFLIIIAIIIKVDSKGPILFTQQRVGKDSKIFKIYKFRSMSIDSPSEIPTSDFINPENYVTKTGEFLRKTSIDELPQLWNILIGDMSFVGPRPVITAEKSLIELRKELGADRFLPGVTGLSQILGRDDLPYKQKAIYDAQYCKEVDFLLDLKIVLKTIKAIIKREHISH